MFLKNFFLQLLLFLFEEICIKFSSTEWVKKSIASFKRHFNNLSIDVNVHNK